MKKKKKRRDFESTHLIKLREEIVGGGRRERARNERSKFPGIE